MTVSITACTGGKESAEIRIATSTQKITRDEDASGYKKGTLEISAFRNEYEAGQIIITPSSKCYYTVETSNLVSESGEVLSKDDFSVYHEKFIFLRTRKDPLSEVIAGDVPDALLPFDKAVEYKENVIEAGTNQPVWITLKTSKTQAAGEYNGKFKVTVGATAYDVPVKVTVYDYTLSDEVHSKSAFSLNDYTIEIYEQDCTPEMVDAYHDFLFEHRLSSAIPYTVSGNSWTSGSNDFTTYFEYAVAYTKNPKCSTISVPWKRVSGQVIEVTEEGLLAIDDERKPAGEKKTDEIVAIDFDAFEDVLYQFVEHSVSANVDLFSKAKLGITLFDEFDQRTTEGYYPLNQTVYILRRTNDITTKFSEVIDGLKLSGGKVTFSKKLAFDATDDNGGVGYSLVADGSGKSYDCSLTEEEFETLKESMKTNVAKILNATTCLRSAPEFFFENVRTNFCPLADFYSSDENISKAVNYAKECGSEVWIYTSCEPRAPYPTYHIDDVQLSARLLSWMMYDFGIKGNLFWSTALGQMTQDENCDMIDGQDYYGEPQRYPGANGDGFMMYPGRPYGIYGPVSSIRLESILDGNEEYDLMYALEELYLANGVSAEDVDEVIKLITNGLYTGTIVNYDGDYDARFVNCRKMLAGLLEFAANNSTVIKSYDALTGKIELVAPVGCVIAADGKTLTGKAEGNIVTYEVTLSASSILTSTLNGKSYSVALYR